MIDPWVHLEAERREVAALLRTLDETDADRPSLCEGWRVRDVAGHLYWVASTRNIEVAQQWLLAGGKASRMIAELGRAAGSQPLDALADKLDATAASRQIAPGLKPMGYLCDAVVHHQDMLRPLGRTRSIPEDRLAAALRFYLSTNGFTAGKRRTAGLHLVATDVDFDRGSGPEVRGPGEALLLAGVGRSVALADLEGDGVEVLATRV